MRFISLFLMPLFMLVGTSSALAASDPWQFDPAAEPFQCILRVDGSVPNGPQKMSLVFCKLEEFEGVRSDLQASGGMRVFQDMGSGPVVVSELVESGGVAQEQPPMARDLDALDEEEGPPVETIADPLEPINRAIYHFNDKLYFWLLKPAARGWRAIAPEPVRVAVNHFFHNILFPVRFFNCLFQAKFSRAGDEVTRFVVNTIVGVAGFYDVADKRLNIKPQEEDLGQTLGVYGLGHGFFINLPILGPSSLRDGLGRLGDIFLNPVNYLEDFETILAIRASDGVNSTSLTIGDYEALKKAALDPYIAIRDAYYQYRKERVKD